MCVRNSLIRFRVLGHRLMLMIAGVYLKRFCNNAPILTIKIPRLIFFSYLKVTFCRLENENRKLLFLTSGNYKFKFIEICTRSHLFTRLHIFEFIIFFSFCFVSSSPLARRNFLLQFCFPLSQPLLLLVYCRHKYLRFINNRMFIDFLFFFSLIFLCQGDGMSESRKFIGK